MTAPDGPRLFRYYRRFERSFDGDPLAPANLAALRGVYERTISLKSAEWVRDAERQWIDSAKVEDVGERGKRIAEVLAVMSSMSLTTRLLSGYQELVQEPPLCDALRLAAEGKQPNGTQELVVTVANLAERLP